MIHLLEILLLVPEFIWLVLSWKCDGAAGHGTKQSRRDDGLDGGRDRGRPRRRGDRGRGPGRGEYFLVKRRKIGVKTYHCLTTLVIFSSVWNFKCYVLVFVFSSLLFKTLIFRFIIIHFIEKYSPRIQEVPDVASLKDPELFQLLEEAYSYKRPRDRQGKSEIFRVSTQHQISISFGNQCRKSNFVEWWVLRESLCN